MLARVAYTCAALFAIAWAISDLFFSLEHSWILFLYRALAPISTVALALLFTLSIVVRVARGKRITIRSNARWLFAIIVAAAPSVRSFEFIPTFTVRPPLEAPTLKVLSLNALGFRDLSSAIIAQIERYTPDVVTIQEVNPTLATALESHFAAQYTCKILKPAVGSWGMGTIAKNPCSEIPIQPEGSWVGPPIIIETTTSIGSPVIVANIHAVHPHGGVVDPYPAMANRSDLSVWKRLSHPIRDREASIGFLLDTIGETTGRNLIISGDLNASMRNGVYKTIRNRGYNDTWLDQHSVLTGGTWPAPEFLGSAGLGWLLRIDFMFRSDTLLPIDVELLPDSIGSDHRGLFARFALLQ
jgi:endonuclease/exonuclease/phosphatase (EEP) superfamily protein YafD